MNGIKIVKTRMRAALLLSTVGILVIALSACVNDKNIEPVDYMVVNANVISMAENTAELDTVMRDHAIVVKDDVIIAIVPQIDATKRFDASKIIDAKGGYVMPGLADMHAHIRMDAEHTFKLFLANGVTTVRNMRIKDGGHDHLALRSAINEKRMLGPRYLITGMQIKEENTYTKTSAQMRIDEHLVQNYDFMKIHGDMPKAAFETLMALAHKHNIRVSGHIQHHMPLEVSLQMSSVEHMEEFLYAVNDIPNNNGLLDFLARYRAKAAKLEGQSYRDSIIQQVKDSDTFISPTLTVYHALTSWVDDDEFARTKTAPSTKYLSEGIKAIWLSDTINPYREEGFPMSVDELNKNSVLLRSLTGDMHRAGIPFILSVDAFGTLVPGFSIHTELQLLVDSGLTPYEALQTGTLNVAKYLGDEQTRGSLAAGKVADFIVLSKNPLKNIQHSKSVWGVMTQGQWLLSETLLSDM